MICHGVWLIVMIKAVTVNEKGTISSNTPVQISNCALWISQHLDCHHDFELEIRKIQFGRSTQFGAYSRYEENVLFLIKLTAIRWKDKMDKWSDELTSRCLELCEQSFWNHDTSVGIWPDSTRLTLQFWLLFWVFW